MLEQKNALEIKIRYLKNDKDRLRIFGENFVKNNKEKSKIIYKNKKHELKEFIDEIDPNLKNKNEIELILNINKDINDMSYMFYECKTLKSFPESKSCCSNSLESLNFNEKSENSNELYANSSTDEISKIYSKNDNQISSGKSLLSDVYKGLDLLITFKIKKMEYMFYGCESLESLPDILSNLDTSEVSDMSHIFHLCKSLKSLPDISNWKTHNITKMNDIFNQCSSLESLPDISKWNTQNVTDLALCFLNVNH